MSEDQTIQMKSEDSWFGAKLRYAVLVADAGLTRYEDRVYIFQHADADTAWDRAFEIGKSHEHEYVSAEGKRVRWRLAKVWDVKTVFLDPGHSNELEVYHETVPVKIGSLPFDWEFKDASVRPNYKEGGES